MVYIYSWSGCRSHSREEVESDSLDYVMDHALLIFMNFPSSLITGAHTESQ